MQSGKILVNKISYIHKVVGFVLALVLVNAAYTGIAYAGGAVGPGGSGGSGDGGHQSSYGYGWYVYDLSSSGPSNGFRDGTAWGTVVSSCAPYSTQVAVFIVLNASGAAKGYNYEGWTNVKTGGNYISVLIAKDAYDSLDDDLKEGSTWGNNVAWFCFGSTPKYWDAAGISSVNRPTATLGDEVKFTHNLRNIGTADAKGLDWETTGYRNGSNYFNVASGYTDLKVGANKKVSEQTITLDSGMNLKLGDVFCRFIEFPDNEIDPDPWEESTPACVKVTSNYDLYPKVDIPTIVMVPGTQQNVTENVINTNYFVSDRDSPYAVYEYVIPRGQAKPSEAQTNSVFNKVTSGSAIRYAEESMPSPINACNWLRSRTGFGGISPGCRLLSNGSKKFDSESKNHLIIDPPIMPDSYNVGDVVCRIISIGMYKYTTTDTSSRRVSVPVCVTIAKAPHVQVWGNDVKVGDSVWPAGTTNGPRNNASVYTRLVSSGGSNFGSWAEYGIFAPTEGVINSVSGGALALAPTTQPLSFANVTAEPGHWGAAKTIPAITDILDSVPVATTTSAGNININSDLGYPGHSGEWHKVVVNGNTTLQGGAYDIAQGTVIIEVQGTATIASDIVKNSDVAYTQIGNATQIIIVARNIVINSNVGRVDAWLAAVPSSGNSSDGIISTCDSIIPSGQPYYQGLIVSGACNANQLTINGAVMAKKIQFRRTAGAEKPDYGRPAEIINLRPDAYMWGSGYNSAADGTGYPIRTIQTRELPPRF